MTRTICSMLLAALFLVPPTSTAAQDTCVDPMGASAMTSQDTVRAFLGALEEKDMAAFAEVWADDGVQDMPFSPEGFPKRVEGKENIIAHYAAWPEISGDAAFTDDLVFYPMADAEWVFAEYRGRVEILTTGRVYEQRYGGLFHVRDGKIVLFREYYDPAAFAYAFNLGPEGANALGAGPD